MEVAVPIVQGGSPRATGQQSSSGVEVRSAQSLRELTEAFQLVYQKYVESGYMQAHQGRLRFSLQALLPTSTTFVARQDGRISSTLTFIRDSSCGLPLQKVFPAELALLRARGKRVIEGTLLGCGGDEVNVAAIAAIYSRAFGWAVFNKADILAIVVNPKHSDFWNRCMGFSPLASRSSCTYVGGHPGELMVFDLQAFLRGGLTVPRFARRVYCNWRKEAEKAEGRCVLRAAEIISLLSRYPEPFLLAERHELKSFSQFYPEALEWIEGRYIPEPERLVA